MQKYRVNAGVLGLSFFLIFVATADTANATSTTTNTHINAKTTNNTNALDDFAVIKEKIKLAMLKFEQTEPRHWSYTLARYENEEGEITSSIEQYSPQLKVPWQLKKINGQQPSKKQIRKFIKRKNKQQGNINLSLNELINIESLSLVTMDEQQITLGFAVNWQKLGKDSIGKLQGQLTYQLEKQFIDTISIYNRAAFSPMFSANITDLMVTFRFIAINGAVLSEQNEIKMKGSFAYFSEIDETSSERYTDYRYHGD